MASFSFASLLQTFQTLPVLPFIYSFICVCHFPSFICFLSFLFFYFVSISSFLFCPFPSCLSSLLCLSSALCPFFVSSCVVDHSFLHFLFFPFLQYLFYFVPLTPCFLPKDIKILSEITVEKIWISVKILTILLIFGFANIKRFHCHIKSEFL